jgi:PHD/YefM family antitoxin component YafN of YafNO toxin-antitoxin module
MRTTSAAARGTIPATEIRRRGFSTVDKALKRGPVHVLKGNKPVDVIMAEDQFRELPDCYRKSYISRVRRSLKDVKAGRVRRVTVQTLIDELGFDA